MRDKYLLHIINVDGNVASPWNTFIHLEVLKDEYLLP